MGKNNLLIVLVLLLLVSTFSTIADYDTQIVCQSDQECLAQAFEGEEMYCDIVEGTCFLVTEEQTVVSNNETDNFLELTPLEEEILLLEEDVSKAREEIISLKSDISSVKTDVNRLKNSISTLQRNVDEVETRLDSELNIVALGISGLEENLNITESSLNQIQETLKKQASNRKLSIIFFIIFVLGAGSIVFHYLNRKGMGSRSKVSNVHSYVNNQIKGGLKEAQIKQNLLNAGWSKQDVDKVYQEVTEKNYKKYLKKRGQPQTKTKQTTKNYDRNKILAIAGVSILLILGVFFILSGVVGKAIFTDLHIDNESKRVSYSVECTSPHIPTPEGDSCCLDENTNGICDVTEARSQGLEQVGQGEDCTDNLQCGSNEYCIGGTCGTLAGLYQGSDNCARMCNYHSLNLSTSDGEVYRVQPGSGSYTAAGALEWKIKQAPDHCIGEDAVVPISIIKKDTGRIINEAVITLRENQESAVITHPNFPQVSFSIRMGKIFETCS